MLNRAQGELTRFTSGRMDRGNVSVGVLPRRVCIENVNFLALIICLESTPRPVRTAPHGQFIATVQMEEASLRKQQPSL